VKRKAGVGLLRLAKDATPAARLSIGTSGRKPASVKLRDGLKLAETCPLRTWTRQTLPVRMKGFLWHCQPRGGIY